MKKTSFPTSDPRRAFTLIELLIVVAVIAILAGLLFPVMGAIGAKRIQKVGYTELAQVQAAIEAYKSKKGTYPPDNPTNVMLNPLYYELCGATVTTIPAGYLYTTLDGSSKATGFDLMRYVGVSNIVNSSTSARGTDDNAAPEAFLKNLRVDQYGSNQTVRILVCSEGWTKPGQSGSAPWRYNVSHPTNNPNSYDLWVDLYIKGKTYRINNWSKDPQIF